MHACRNTCHADETIVFSEHEILSCQHDNFIKNISTNEKSPKNITFN
jgi:hypothetical protein